MARPMIWQIKVQDTAPVRPVATGKGDERVKHPKVSLMFDDDIFLTLRRRALNEGTTFAEQVRRALRKAVMS